ncbi:hypothetical protein L484_007585 [Morus notabilis]|uniref:Uncharacterized protein n=1 Tax=Morus notabilis TaxID=981085 RepID=W9QM76_9ROSA|nr:hypothetical protein L484_007585 [Morus notabilis]
MAKIYSSVVENIMSRDLEISAEMDTETLRGWVEEIKENPNLLKSLIREHPIGNERRSGGTCRTTYWITPVQHEAADAESAPMPLAMPCLVPRYGGALVGPGVSVKGASAYPGVIITTYTSHLGTVERVTRLLSHSTTFVPVIHSLTERSSEGQPAHTASGEDGTTGKDRLAKTPQA